jgi:hypothetical protein
VGSAVSPSLPAGASGTPGDYFHGRLVYYCSVDIDIS